LIKSAVIFADDFLLVVDDFKVEVEFDDVEEEVVFFFFLVEVLVEVVLVVFVVEEVVDVFSDFDFDFDDWFMDDSDDFFGIRIFCVVVVVAAVVSVCLFLLVVEF